VERVVGATAVPGEHGAGHVGGPTAQRGVLMIMASWPSAPAGIVCEVLILYGVQKLYHVQK
jgi:hypothetical protein